MFDIRRIGLSLACCTVANLSMLEIVMAGTASGEVDLAPSALKARLQKAENDFRSGNLTSAIAEASVLQNTVNRTDYRSVRFAGEVKQDLAVFQLKAGHPDETAKLMRELLLSLQLEIAEHPNFESEADYFLVWATEALKNDFSEVLDRLGEKPDTKMIVNSIIENTYPKDYASQLKAYCKRVRSVMAQLEPLQSIANNEQDKYGDALRSLDADGVVSAPNLDLSEANLAKLGESLDKLALEAQQMPACHLGPALGLKTLASVANSQKRFHQAAMFAKQSEQHVIAVAKDYLVLPEIKIVLAYALLREGKAEDFKAVIDDVLKPADERDTVLVTAASLVERSGDDAGALEIYKRMVSKGKKNNEYLDSWWFDSYDRLLKKIGSGKATQ